MLIIGSLVGNAATCTGFVAASIAVVGFLLHATPAFYGASEVTIRRATVAGGLIGFGLAML
ncbi:MAG: hypothetical protein ACREDY_23635 [Bradyrhizobium sp.]